MFESSLQEKEGGRDCKRCGFRATERVDLGQQKEKSGDRSLAFVTPSWVLA